jgi:hypothetical protein
MRSIRTAGRGVLDRAGRARTVRPPPRGWRPGQYIAGRVLAPATHSYPARRLDREKRNITTLTERSVGAPCSGASIARSTIQGG